MEDLYRENPESVITPCSFLLNIWWNTVWSKTVKPYLQSISETDAAAMCHAKKSIRLEAIRLIRLAGGVAFCTSGTLSYEF